MHVKNNGGECLKIVGLWIFFVVYLRFINVWVEYFIHKTYKNNKGHIRSQIQAQRKNVWCFFLIKQWLIIFF